MDANPTMSNALQRGMENVTLPTEAFAFAPVVGAYTLIQWALSAKAEGDGYGFPFDHPHLAFAQRLQRLNAHIERIKDIHLRGRWRDNAPYFKIHIALKPMLFTKTLPQRSLALSHGGRCI